MQSLGTRVSEEALGEGLRRHERVVYRENGNRAVPPSHTLKRLERVATLAGVTRVAEISQLTTGAFPVFQTSRPGILLNCSAGQNTGSQGKGITRNQAKISCLMETFESVCMEPREELLIRGNYTFLRRQHAILPPSILTRQHGATKAGFGESFVWTSALLLDIDSPVLVPAEAVYFPFQPRDYATRPAFCSTSNGVAAGSTYLEATIHALYELIERHYYALWETGRLRGEAFIIKELDSVSKMREFREAIGAEFEIEVLALQLPGIKNLPMIICWLLRRDGAWLYGSGCAPTLDMAIERAVSEAVQTWSVVESGTREDLSEDETVSVTSSKQFPRFRRLTRSAYLRGAPDRSFVDLQDEFRSLKSWLKRAGFPSIAVANLSRHGLDIPVVRAIVPGLKTSRRFGLHSTTASVNSERFSF